MAGFIPPEKYREILESVPITCVDVAARHNNKLLLIKRNNPPLKDAWWLPGGRIFKGETMQEAATRKLKEETNLTGKFLKLVGPYETMFPDGPFGVKTGVHSINAAFLVEVDDISALKADNNHAGCKWFSQMDKNWHPYLKQVLEDCEFFSR